MNESRPELPTKRSPSPLTSAGIGTLALHASLLLLLWLWPRPPLKPQETLLEVDLTQKPEATVQPTEVPTERPEPTPTPKKEEKRVVKVERPEPTPVPVEKPRKVDVVPTPLPAPTAIPVPTALPKPQPKQPKPVATAVPLPSLPTRANSPANSPLAPAAAPSAPKAGGVGRRRFTHNMEPQSDDTRPDAKSSANAGSNSRGRSAETAAAQPGLELPRTRARRGRSGDMAAPSGSAPTRDKDGTEVDLGPSRPTSSTGGSRRAAAGLGNGEDDTGPLRTGGLPGAMGSTTTGNARMGRGADEATGNGVGNGSRGTGAHGSDGRGRRGSRLAGDPFGNPGAGDGNGRGKGSGPGTSEGDGRGNGPGNGTRLVKRNLGDGDGDGGLGRGDGRGSGLGPGNGDVGRGGTGAGPGSGRGDDSADSAGSGRTRVRRVSNAHRENETEDQIGRGIWGGFKIKFYQDKSDHPDLPDGTFFPGNPIDWPVFTKLAAQKTVPNLDFDWGVNPPAPGMKYTFWSLKASGRIFVPKDDIYEFFFDELDDAGSLDLDGKNIIKVWKVQKSSPSSAKMFLERGPHDIQIEYVQGPATAASIKLSWRSTSFPKEIVGVYQAPGE